MSSGESGLEQQNPDVLLASGNSIKRSRDDDEDTGHNIKHFRINTYTSNYHKVVV